MDVLRARVEQAIAERVFPGCVIGIMWRDGNRCVLPVGRLTYESDAPLVSEDTIYDVASVTKSIPVASLASGLIASDRIKLDDKVKKYVPELQRDFGATVGDLLAYRVRGEYAMSEFHGKDAVHIEEEIMRRGFAAPPSADSSYTNLPAFLLGLIIERVADDSLDHLAERQFFKPLGMTRTSFMRALLGDVAPTEIDASGEVRGIVHDESARAFARADRAVGHAGLFSTAPDVLAFLEALLSGEYPHIVEHAQQGLGWQTSGDFLGSHASRGVFGKTGFTGTSVVCDIERGLGLVILSNRTHPHRPPNTSAITAFRRGVVNILYAQGL